MVAEQIKEVIFVGLPGPTHHYGGLSPDNVASSHNRGSLSKPRQAALQALELVRLLLTLAVPAAILPPQLRPHLPLLRQHYKGSDEEVIAQAAEKSPELLEKASSASAMWTANAATIAPRIDTADGKLHITTANLFTNLHRRIEAEDTHRVLKAIFKDVPNCALHPPFSAAAGMCDEGAANHMRLSPTHGEKGLHVFVYGEGGTARQSLSASQAVKSQHCIPDSQALFMRQNPIVIGEGVFHNDVIATSNEHVLLAHALAYEDSSGRIGEAYSALHGKNPTMIIIPEEELSVEEAVHTFFFNSQIVTRADGAMAVIAPLETQLLYDGKAARLLERICRDAANAIDETHYIDLRQSMRNGGGPACLRLRVPMTLAQLGALKMGSNVLANEGLLSKLTRAIETHYPETLSPEELGNPDLYHRCRKLLAELSSLMRLPLLD